MRYLEFFEGGVFVEVLFCHLISEHVSEHVSEHDTHEFLL